MSWTNQNKNSSTMGEVGKTGLNLLTEDEEVILMEDGGSLQLEVFTLHSNTEKNASTMSSATMKSSSSYANRTKNATSFTTIPKNV